MNDQPVKRRNRATQHMSLRDIDKVALKYLARQDSHENASAAMRKLIDSRMRSEIGRDWEAVIQPQQMAVQP